MLLYGVIFVLSTENGTMTLRFGHDTEELKTPGRGRQVKDAIKLTIIKARQERLDQGGQNLWGVLADRMGKDYENCQDKEQVDNLVSFSNDYYS